MSERALMKAADAKRLAEVAKQTRTVIVCEKDGATIAAEEGATASELMAMYGWKKLEEAELYTRTASERRMAARAAERIANVFAPNLNPVRDGADNSSMKTRGQK